MTTPETTKAQIFLNKNEQILTENMQNIEVMFDQGSSDKFFRYRQGIGVVWGIYYMAKATGVKFRPLVKPATVYSSLKFFLINPCL